MTAHQHKAINNLAEWCDRWLLGLNINKCSVLHLGREERSNSSYAINSDNGSVILKSSTLEKDLGILVDSKLKFDSHINNIVNKANRLVGLIRRSFNFLDAKNFSLIFKAIVRPTLEYGQVVWSPYQEGLINKIENIQRRATKMLPGLKKLDYEERLKILNLPTLESRRKRGDLIETFKFIKGHYNISTTLLELNTESVTRGHKYKIKHNYAKLNTRKFFFTNRVAKSWNNLPAEVVEADSINCFKNRLDRHWKENSV
jgi:hypothetical protein